MAECVQHHFEGGKQMSAEKEMKLKELVKEANRFIKPPEGREGG